MKYENQIIQGDCLEVMRELPDKCIDLVLTDPPYGIGAATRAFVNGNRRKRADRTSELGDWDSQIPSKEYFDEMRRVSKNQIIWGGNYFIEYLKNSRCFLVWDKTIHGNSYADCEMAWTSYDANARIKYLNMVSTTMDGRVHPTQKPLELIRWCLQYFPDAQTILDPFMGSGTTCVAAKQLGRKYIGIEISEKYCKIAEDRLRQEILL